ncbi:MAG: O-antigen ligase family protein, partial [Bacteroidales bacterium]|nr:O-antigen ligase family protein [Bacteroidales bacterium]
HRLLLPSQKGVNATFRYALPYLVLYGVLLVSCFFSDNVSNNFSYCGRYFCLFLIPLVFVGMTPSFLTARRLRIFAFCLVAGAVIGALWKFFVLQQVYFCNRLDVYREQGFSVGIRHFYGNFQFRYFINELGYKLVHPAFEALFELMALVVVLRAWIKRDVFFSHGYGKVLAVFAIGIIIINLLLFCTKTAALECVLSIFALWVYALCKKRYVFVGASAIGVLLCMGVLTFRSPEMVFSRYNQTIQASKDFLKGRSTEEDASFIPRIHTYKIGWELFKEKPLTGWGFFYTKEFEQRYKRYLNQISRRFEWEKKILIRSHNQLLEIVDSCGIVGGMVFVWILVCVFRDVWRRKSLFWWIWFVGLVVICTIDMPFNRTTGLIYLCGFHGILFCELTSNFLHPEDSHKPLVSEKSAEGV